MGFFCIKNDSYGEGVCNILISIYWALIYIIVVDIVASIYLMNSTSKLFKIEVPNTIPGPDVSGNVDVSGTSVPVDLSGAPITTTKLIKMDKPTVKYITKIIGVFNLILIIVISLVIAKFIMVYNITIYYFM